MTTNVVASVQRTLDIVIASPFLCPRCDNTFDDRLALQVGTVFFLF